VEPEKRLDSSIVELEEIGERAERDTARYFVLGYSVLAIIAITYSIDILAVIGPAVVRDIGASPTDIDLGTTLLLAGAGGAVMLMGQLADKYGHKTTFLWPGACAMIFGGLLATFATDSLMLIIGRVLIGVGSVGLAVPALGFCNLRFPTGDPMRGVAFGLIAAGFGFGFVLAPILGGALNEISTIGWRLASGVVVLLALACFIGIARTVKNDKAMGKSEGIDVVGSVLLMGALGFLIIGLNEVTTYGWVKEIAPVQIAGWVWSLPISLPLLLLVLSALAWASFIIYEIRRNKSGQPRVLEIELFRERSFAFGLVTCVFFFLGSFAAILIIPQFFLIVLGYGSLELGLALLPVGAGIVLFGYLAGPIGNKITARFTVILGFLLIIIGALASLPVFTVDSNGWLTLGPLFVFGSGFGLVYARVTEVVLGSVPPALAGVGSATMLALRLLAGAVGAALLSVLLISTAADQAQSELAESTSLTAEQHGELASLVDRGARLRQEAGGLDRVSGAGSKTYQDLLRDPELSAATKDISEGFAYAFRIELIIVALISLIGLLSAFLLPKPRK
jgi:MFS family permease